MPVILSSATTDRHSPTLPLFHRCQRSASLPRRVNFGSLEDGPRFVHFSSADPELHGCRHHEVVDGGVVSALGCNRSPAVAEPFYTPGRATIRTYLLGGHDPYDCAVAPNFTLKETFHRLHVQGESPPASAPRLIIILHTNNDVLLCYTIPNPDVKFIACNSFCFMSS